jgi:uncharacterized repeat protein (TIGR03803 family)
MVANQELTASGNRTVLAITIIISFVAQLVSYHSSAQFAKLLDFGATPNGTLPNGTPVSDGTFLYGMTSEGGANNLGIIYKMRLDGTDITTLLHFDGVNNGANPFGSLLLEGTFLYGMTRSGGANGHGTIFKIKPDGTAFAKLLDFSSTVTGAFPQGSLISDGTFLYGITTGGGSFSYGALFKIMPDGTGFTKLYDFDYGNSGASAFGSPILVGGFLYGMTSIGGANSSGTIYKIRTDGTNYSKLLDFHGATTGNAPLGSLYSDGTFLYGMTRLGGTANHGTIFRIQTNGGGYLRLLNFSEAAGAYPKGSLISDGTSLYGTTSGFGSGAGTVFKINADGTGFLKLADINGATSGLKSEGTLLYDAASFSLFGLTSNGTNGFGNMYKLNRNGTGYSTLFNFEIEGHSPQGSLTLDGGFLYGMTNDGGAHNQGTIFRINPDGTGLAKLHDFDGINGGKSTGTLVSDGTFLYGMTYQGGVNGFGTIFKINRNGSGFVKLFDFDIATTGGVPNGALLLSGTVLYGMTSNGGTIGYGTIFKISTAGTGFLTLRNLDNLDGTNPKGSLISDGTFLYGMTSGGGNLGGGTIFKILPDGNGFAAMHEFDLNNGGHTPNGSLLLDGGFLYGMTSSGGTHGDGTIFKIKTDGSGFSALYDIELDPNISGGGGPLGSLIVEGSNLFGMVSAGGPNAQGNIFKIKADGTSYTNLLDFDSFNGSGPTASLVTDGSFLYGMTPGGGANGKGTLFRTTLTPFVSISNFEPPNGVVGTHIIISGNGFDPITDNNTVKFSNITAVVKASTPTSLTVVVPVGATTGPIEVTAGTTATSSADFIVDTEAVMVNTTVQNCNVIFLPPTYAYTNAHNDMATETFVPVNPSDKVKISFLSFNVTGDILYVYDGPSDASPLLATLQGTTVPPDVAATGPGGELTLVYYWQDGSTSWNGTISCVSTGPTIIINTQPSNFIACVGDVATFTTTATGTTNIAYQWQYATTLAGTYNDIANGSGYSNVATTTLLVNTTGNFGAGFYRCKVSGDNAATVFTAAAQLTVNALPTAPTVTGASNCGAGSVVLNASGGIAGQYRWYNDATSTTPIAGETNATFTTPSLTADATYYVSINNGTCESVRTSATATINPLPTAPTATGGTTCSGSTATLNAAGGTSGQYRWYSDATIATPIAGQTNGTFITPLITASTTFHVSVDNGTCESTRTPVTATVSGVCNQPPAINATAIKVQVQGSATISLAPLLSDPDNNLNLASLRVAVQPASGAKATIEAGQNLGLDYTGINFSGTDQLAIEVCDFSGACSQRELSVEVEGEMIAYNAVSPGRDGKKVAKVF